jgi:hypothetical protein
MWVLLHRCNYTLVNGLSAADAKGGMGGEGRFWYNARPTDILPGGMGALSPARTT